MLTTVNIDDITIGERLRKEEGDLTSMVGSIAMDGLINPIVINKDKLLLCGYRRLKACKILHLETIPVTVKDITDKVKIAGLQLMENEWLNYTQVELDGIKEKWGITAPAGYEVRETYLN